MEKELKIDIPEGYEIDKENSTFECIRFKKKPERWVDGIKNIQGFWITTKSQISTAYCIKNDENRNVFATVKQAKSALAIAQISQIIKNDERFGGPVADEEWCRFNLDKYIIYRRGGNIHTCDTTDDEYYLLAFHTKEQRDLFLKENENLVKDYLMID